MVEQPPLSVSDMPGIADWRRLVERQLKGRDFASLQSRTRDGIVIEPLYQRPDRRTAPRRPRRRAPGSIVQLVDDPDPDRANAQALEDLARRRDRARAPLCRRADCGDVRASADRRGARASRSRASTSPPFTCASIRIRRPGARARRLGDLVAEAGIAPERTHVDFGLDPDRAAVRLCRSAGHVECARLRRDPSGSARAGFRRALGALDARVLHEAGAQRGAGDCRGSRRPLPGGCARLTRHGIAAGPPSPASAPTVCRRSRPVPLHRQAPRPAPVLCARLEELCGAPPSHLPLHAETSRRMMTRADPHTNLLRTTIAAFAAGAGGADSIAGASLHRGARPRRRPCAGARPQHAAPPPGGSAPPSRRRSRRRLRRGRGADGRARRARLGRVPGDRARRAASSKACAPAAFPAGYAEARQALAARDRKRRRTARRRDDPPGSGRARGWPIEPSTDAVPAAGLAPDPPRSPRGAAA